MTTRKFIKTILDYYHAHGRQLPWRETKDPYAIWISEIMLQQTQVDRVIPKYQQWLSQFPLVQSLAAAPLTNVLTAWQGLGYNRRGLNIHRAAQMIANDWQGKLPGSAIELQTLPGIGPYTAAAIATFAYNQTHTLIETNIRTVYLHYFFPDESAVPDAKILPIITKTLDHNNPRQWYWALMDYGAHLKKSTGNANQRSKHFRRQSQFKNSNRQLRGNIIKQLTTTPSLTVTNLRQLIEADKVKLISSLTQLEAEGFLTRDGDQIWLN